MIAMPNVNNIVRASPRGDGNGVVNGITTIFHPKAQKSCFNGDVNGYAKMHIFLLGIHSYNYWKSWKGVCIFGGKKLTIGFTTTF